MSDARAVEAYVDGACSGNPGRGGWAVIVTGRDVGDTIERVGTVKLTTNNRMELQAAIEALRICAQIEGVVAGNMTITTDSQYVVHGATRWLTAWKRRQWRAANSRQVIKNIDQWQELDNLITALRPEFKWIKGHSGLCAHHTRVDHLARDASRSSP
jgi:ribonuclease HI